MDLPPVSVFGEAATSDSAESGSIFVIFDRTNNFIYENNNSKNNKINVIVIFHCDCSSYLNHKMKVLTLPVFAC